MATENLTTLFAVVPKSGKSEWLTSYEQLSDFVVRFARGARCCGVHPLLPTALSACMHASM